MAARIKNAKSGLTICHGSACHIFMSFLPLAYAFMYCRLIPPHIYINYTFQSISTHTHSHRHAHAHAHADERSQTCNQTTMRELKNTVTEFMQLEQSESRRKKLYHVPLRTVDRRHRKNGGQGNMAAGTHAKPLDCLYFSSAQVCFNVCVCACCTVSLATASMGVNCSHAAHTNTHARRIRSSNVTATVFAKITYSS